MGQENKSKQRIIIALASLALGTLFVTILSFTIDKSSMTGRMLLGGGAILSGCDNTAGAQEVNNQTPIQMALLDADGAVGLVGKNAHDITVELTRPEGANPYLWAEFQKLPAEVRGQIEPYVVWSKEGGEFVIRSCRAGVDGVINTTDDNSGGYCLKTKRPWNGAEISALEAEGRAAEAEGRAADEGTCASLRRLADDPEADCSDIFEE